MKVLITGSSNGIGKATAKKFLAEGFSVIGFDINLKSIDDPNYTHYIVDIANISHDYLKNEIPDVGDIDILVNNAGVQNSLNDIDVNLKGAIQITEHFLKRRTLRSIVMVASTSAHTGAEFPEYAASKGGLLSYTKNVANRCAAWRCTCNSISPGGVITDLNRPVMDNRKLWNMIMAVTPMKRWASAQEIAEWIYFMSAVNRSMTGQDIIIDNGELINSNFVWTEN